MAKRTYRQTCASCGESLLYSSWHCIACVETERVCQMCDTSIADKRTDATFCGQSCKQAESRQRNAITGENSGNNGNVTDVTAILEAAKRIEDATSAMLSPGKTSGMLLETIAQNTGMTLTQIEDMTKAINRLAAALENQPRETQTRHTYVPSPNAPAPEMLDDIELEITEAKSDVNANANFIYSMLMISGKTEEARAMRESMTTKQSGPKSLADADVVFDVPDFDDDEFDI